MLGHNRAKVPSTAVTLDNFFSFVKTYGSMRQRPVFNGIVAETTFYNWILKFPKLNQEYLKEKKEIEDKHQKILKKLQKARKDRLVKVKEERFGLKQKYVNLIMETDLGKDLVSKLPKRRDSRKNRKKRE